MRSAGLTDGGSADGDPADLGLVDDRQWLHDLLLRCAQSDEEALAAFYTVTSPLAWRVALSTLASVAEAEDALVQTYATVWRESDTFVSTQLSAWAWTLGILRKHLRAARPRP